MFHVNDVQLSSLAANISLSYLELHQIYDLLVMQMFIDTTTTIRALVQHAITKKMPFMGVHYLAPYLLQKVMNVFTYTSHPHSKGFPCGPKYPYSVATEPVR